MNIKEYHKNLIAAARCLELPDRANLTTIKRAHHEMIHKWHPDKCKDDKKKCEEKTIKVIEAYNLIMGYCNSFEYPFSEKSLKSNMTDREVWAERFRNDPIWGHGPMDEK